MHFHVDAGLQLCDENTPGKEAEFISMADVVQKLKEQHLPGVPLSLLRLSAIRLSLLDNGLFHHRDFEDEPPNEADEMFWENACDLWGVPFEDIDPVPMEVKKQFVGEKCGPGLVFIYKNTEYVTLNVCCEGGAYDFETLPSVNLDYDFIYAAPLEYIDPTR